MITEASDADFAALLAGQAPGSLKLPEGMFEDPAVLTMLRDLATTIRPTFTPASWLVVAHGEVVGLCSLVRMPSDGAIDIGYGIMQARRGMGHATAAVQALLMWARADKRVHLCRAETSIHNRPSQRVLESNGFQRTGVRTDDEDGDLICWSLPVTR
jgi:RimJ/RimL family protein N-acetyltransferase